MIWKGDPTILWGISPFAVSRFLEGNFPHLFTWVYFYINTPQSPINEYLCEEGKDFVSKSEINKYNKYKSLRDSLEWVSKDDDIQAVLSFDPPLCMIGGSLKVAIKKSDKIICQQLY